MACISCNGS
ncbi:hypothetical protein YPPY02_2661, partial [Yersinia pestis PY-02]